MYKALYRKYRPKTLDDVVGQQRIVKTLKNEIIYNKLSHAYLFCGPRGTGKTSIAKIFSKIVNCNNIEGYKACDECVNCTQYDNNQNVDIIEIDAASNNGVDEIRELKSKISLVPTTGKYKIYIIDEVHMLTTGAFNALLKTLEEPPKHIIFILATTDPHKIPNTILSRCQRFDFEKICINDIVERLQFIVKRENILITEDALKEIARSSDGGMRDSISMLDQLISYTDKEITIDDVHALNGTINQVNLVEFLKSIISGNVKKSLDLLDEFYINGKNINKIIEESIVFLRNLLLVKVVPNSFNNSDELKEEYEIIAQEISENKLIDFISQLNGILNDTKLSNNSKLLLELCIIKFNIKENFQKRFQNNNITEKSVVDTQKNNNIENIKKVANENKNIEQSNNYSEEYLKEIEEFRKIRINNALVNLNKSLARNIMSKENDIRRYILDEKYNKLASLILDGTIKASGNNTVIYVYKTDADSQLFNSIIPKIETFFNQLLNVNIKVISTNIEDWEIIKNEFNSKSKKYFNIDEPDLNNILKKLESNTTSPDELKNIFGNIVEYENNRKEEI